MFLGDSVGGTVDTVVDSVVTVVTGNDVVLVVVAELQRTCKMNTLNKPHYEETNILHLRKQRRRSASQ